jgi:hypothetical protein
MTDNLSEHDDLLRRARAGDAAAARLRHLR